MQGGSAAAARAGARADRCLLWLLGVEVLPPGPPVLEVVVPRGAVLPVRAAPLQDGSPPGAIVPLLGPDRLRCLRTPRAAADLLRRLPLVDAVVVTDAVRHAGLVEPGELAEELDLHARLRGVRRARRALELSDVRAESPPESRLRIALVLAGFVPVPQSGFVPVPQYDVRVMGRLVARVDLAFPDLRIAVEYDGRPSPSWPMCSRATGSARTTSYAPGGRCSAPPQPTSGAAAPRPSQVRALIAARAAA